MANTNKVRTLTHRDSGVRAADTVREPIVSEEDAPGSGHHEGQTGEILASALRSVEKDSEAERALIAVMELLAHKHTGGGDGNGDEPKITRRFVARAIVALASVITLVQPTVDNVVERWLSPRAALEVKLDETIAAQATLQAQQVEMHRTFIALAKWIVECEVADSRGLAMPEPPAPVRLILVQDELGRSTGP